MKRIASLLAIAGLIAGTATAVASAKSFRGQTIEVGVDAMTGKVLENGAENAAKEAKEAVQEKRPVKH